MIAAAQQLSPAARGVELYTGVVAGREEAGGEPGGLCRVPQRTKFDGPVAPHAGIRCTAGLVLAPVVIEHFAVIGRAHIDQVVVDAQTGGHPPRQSYLLGFARPIASVKRRRQLVRGDELASIGLHGHAGDPVAPLEKQRGGHRGIDAAAHAHQNVCTIHDRIPPAAYGVPSPNLLANAFQLRAYSSSRALTLPKTDSAG